MFLTFCSCSFHKNRVLKIAEYLNTELQKDNYDKNEVTHLAGNLNVNYFSEKNLKKYSSADLEDIHESMGTLSFYFPENDEYSVYYESVFDEKVRRKEYNSDEVVELFRHCVRTRNFDKAYDIRKTYSDVKFPYIPEQIISRPALLSDASSARIYEIFKEGKKAELKSISLNEGKKIIITFFTGCTPAYKAITKIMADTELSLFFQNHSALMTSKFDTVGVAGWKKHFNLKHVYIVYKNSDFPEFDLRSSPNFYFMEDGKILSDMPDWQFSVNAKRILKKFKKSFN